MSDYSLNANSIPELEAAFAEAGKHLAGQIFPDVTFNLSCTGTARAAMEEIIDAKMKRNTTSTVVAGGGGTSVGFAVAAATAPFLGPFCMLAGMVAGGLAGAKADDISRSVFLSKVIEEYGEELVSQARQFKRQSYGNYVRRDRYRGGSDPGYSGN